MSFLSGYSTPILTACAMFIPLAGLFTLPFMIYQYRKYGSIPILRIAVVYGFILYMMCAFLLTVLPVPTPVQMKVLAPRTIQYIPFSTYITAFKKAGFSLSQPATFFRIYHWKTFFRSSGFLEIVANIIMQIPLGVFLRYYFRCNWKKTLLIGFCVTLFYELTQLTGFWFMFPKAWRICSVDDLMDNTLGCMIGYWITPVLCALLPSRDELDRISLRSERRVTLTRRITALVIDWIPFTVIWILSLTLISEGSLMFFVLSFGGYMLWSLMVFVGIQHFCHGQTLGKFLLRIAVKGENGTDTPTPGQLFIRYSLQYLLLPLLVMAGMTAAILTVTALYSHDKTTRIVGLITSFLLIGTTSGTMIHLLVKHHSLPHSYRSHTTVVLVPRKHAARH